MMARIWAPTNASKNNMKSILFCLSLILIITNANAQEHDSFSLVFYNVENLFDTRNDSLTADDEFTPAGDRHWTRKRFDKKIVQLSKVILAVDGWEMPDLIALCEVENRYVLQELTTKTPLQQSKYKIIHKESPDPRGIDVALLYNPVSFYPIAYNYFPLVNTDGNVRRSREILHVEGVVNGKDTLHVFVNHWPSRYSGLLKTRPARQQAAQLLAFKYQEIIRENQQAKVVILGDFNDQPIDESLHKYLGAVSPESEAYVNEDLLNLSWQWMSEPEGTLKYQSQWYVFDQVIVSGGLLNAGNGLYTNAKRAEICNLPFLFEADKTHGGRKLFRTYSGYRYNGGFSDHLPVKLTLLTH